MAYIKIDGTNRITAASHNFHCGDGELVVAIPDDISIEEMHNYKFENNEFVYDPLPVNDSVRIAELKQYLRDTVDDVLQIIEGVSTLSECAEIIKKRSEWRKELKELEAKQTTE